MDKRDISDSIEVISSPLISFISSYIADTAIAAAIPSIGGILIAYKQKRAEKMLREFILKINNDIDKIETNLSNLSAKRYEEIKEVQYGQILDYVIDNNQEEKIKYIANGFINLTSYESFKDDILIIYYDTLKRLNMLDLNVLTLNFDYSVYGRRIKIEDIEGMGINITEFDIIQERLIREGLLKKIVSDELAELAENMNRKNYLSYDYVSNYNSPWRQVEHDKGKCLLTEYGKKFIEFFKENDENKEPLE